MLTTSQDHRYSSVELASLPAGTFFLEFFPTLLYMKERDFRRKK